MWGAWLLVLGAMLVPAAEPGTSEAAGAVRAKIEWLGATAVNSQGTPVPVDTELGRDPNQVGPFALFRAGTLTRQSNADVLNTQVLVNDAVVPSSGVCQDEPEDCKVFHDTLTFRSTSNIEDAVIRVHQPVFGTAAQKRGNQGECHVAILGLDLDGVPVVDDPAPDALGRNSTVQLDAGTLLANELYELRIESRMPPKSQDKQPGKAMTPRILTSLIRITERTKDITIPTPGETPAVFPPPRPCEFVTAERALRSLNKAVTVRTELQTSQWAVKNGRPTPTPIVVR